MTGSTLRSSYFLGGIFSALVFGLVLLFTISELRRSKFKEITTSISTFVDAWNRQDAAGILSMAADEDRPTIERQLERLRRWPGFEQGWPKIAESDALAAEVEAKGAGFATEILFPIGGERLEVHWCRDEHLVHWELTRVVLPMPALDPMIDEFKNAWRGSDVDAIVRLFPEKSRENLRREIDRHAKQESWRDGFPSLELQSIGPLGYAHAQVQFTCAGQKLGAIWNLDEKNDWQAQRIVWPNE